MEDDTIRILCAAVAEQVLVPPAEPPQTESRKLSSAVDFPHRERLQELKRAAAAITHRAITLYRLCRHARPPVTVSSGVGGAQDAAFCVCVCLKALQPAVWGSLVRRAKVLRPRAPSVLLGRPVPVEVSLKDVDRFDARSQHLMATRNAADSGAPLNAASSSGSGSGGVQTAAIDDTLAERLAALYYFPLLSPAQRKKFPQILKDMRVVETAGNSNHNSGKAGHKRPRASEHQLSHLYGGGADAVDQLQPGGGPASDSSSEDDEGNNPQWAAMLAFAMSDDMTMNPAQTSSQPHESADPKKQQHKGVEHIFRAARQLRLVEIAAQVEATKHFIFWQGFEACVLHPILFMSRHSDGDARRAASVSDLHNGIGSAYSSACGLHFNAGELSGPFVSSDAHMLHPARAQQQCLLPRSPSLTTGVFLWQRLLTCAVWVSVYAEVFIPLTVRALRDGGGQMKSGQQISHLLTPLEMKTVAFAVSVIREARHYDTVCCPICDTLRSDRATLRWTTLAAPRATLKQDMSPFLQSFFSDCVTVSSSATASARGGASTAAAAAETWLDSPYEAHLRCCWRAFGSALDTQAAFSSLRYERQEEKEGDEDTSFSHAREVFAQVLSRRLHAVSELLYASSASRRAGKESAHLARAGGDAAVGEEEATALQRHGWILGDVSTTTKKKTATQPSASSSQTASSTSLRSVRGWTLRDITSKLLLTGCAPSRCASFLLGTDVDTAPPSLSSLSSSSPPAVARGSPPPPRPGVVDATPMRSSNLQQAATDVSVRYYQEQLQQLQDLLDFVPAVPPLRAEDAVLECVHCFSLFHQDCVGPIQRDVAQGCFLCHTCRLRRASLLAPLQSGQDDNMDDAALLRYGEGCSP